ncbi:superoxide dismutase family protein [Caulobacter sp. S45]|uniref:superoxide dismutase family protein n=1 Tax=Caulobacter sp. S45 TaxID=1641861 RepID=UPI00131B5A69|nr:superoxide dismutase family protein [Caulobacter sp. S45]
MKTLLCSMILAAGLASTAQAATLTAPVALATPTGPGAPVGTVTISDGPSGAILTTDLHGLPPGVHGFHVHAMGSCAAAPDKTTGKIVPAGAAGGHMDPSMSGKHEGPMGMGHLGDLPALTVAADGTAKESLAAPHISSVAALKGHALMIHAGGDNYSDAPAPLGGGGARIACGVIG